MRNFIKLCGEGEDLGTSIVNMKSSSYWVELEISVLREISQTQTNSMFVMSKAIYLNTHTYVHTHTHMHRT